MKKLFKYFKKGWKQKGYMRKDLPKSGGPHSKVQKLESLLEDWAKKWQPFARTALLRLDKPKN